MDDRIVQLCSSIIPATYVKQAQNAAFVNQKILQILLEHKRIPDEAISDQQIEHILHQLSEMDSNNFPSICGAGEREGRIFSQLVTRRHYHLSHGIGRSGELTAVQPKAAGSSIIAKLSNKLALHALKLSGALHVKDCFVVPVATGLTLTLCFLALRKTRPKAKFIIWPRIDQKSCFKSMVTAGFEPIVIKEMLVGDELRTDLEGIRRKVEELGAENVLCVHTTTSCFAPRAPDDLPGVSRLCKDFDIPHIVNNAYGVQLSKCMHLVEEGARVGRLDLFVQSLDKNFLVPVGGALLAGYNTDFLRMVDAIYPGRASGTPSVDLFITLLSMGVSGYKKLLEQRKVLFDRMKAGLEKLASELGERVLDTPNNKVSLAFSLITFNPSDVTMLGSMLFVRNVSGARVQSGLTNQSVAGYEFRSFGSHYDRYPFPYINVAVAIGASEDEVDTVLSRLSAVLKQARKGLPEIQEQSCD